MPELGRGWQKAKVVIAGIAAILVPLATVCVGNTYSTAIKERELEGHFVEIALDILRHDPESGAKDLRSWATSIVDKYSGVKLSDAARQELIDRRLPKDVTWEDLGALEKGIERLGRERDRIIERKPESGVEK